MSLQVTQLEELLAVRHSVFVVGGPGTGKSQVSFSTTATTQQLSVFTVHDSSANHMTKTHFKISMKEIVKSA